MCPSTWQGNIGQQPLKESLLGAGVEVSEKTKMCDRQSCPSEASSLLNLLRTSHMEAVYFQRSFLHQLLRFSIFLPMWKTLMIPLQDTLSWSSNSCCLHCLQKWHPNSLTNCYCLCRAEGKSQGFGLPKLLWYLQSTSQTINPCVVFFSFKKSTI